MKGDFSKWGLTPADNFSGVLHQQGRVLLDQDWNAAAQIQALWRDSVGQDVVGGGLVAVPVAVPDSFKLLQAKATASEVTVTLNPGRAWVDGQHYVLDAAAPLTLLAEYFGPPQQSPAATPASIAAGVRDAVVMELWDDAFSAYQDPLGLLEPALGGPDTTERVKTQMALKLLRLQDGQGCSDLPIADNFGAKGRLSVTPSPTTVIAGPCPVPDSGGYSGFAHYLYRIEIATADSGGKARFKWSQFNGGLVGRGSFTSTGASTATVAISANNAMIDQSGLDAFYLEALAFDAALGRWRVVLSADATLPSAGTLSLSGIAGAWPAGSTAFFRLWNGIAQIEDFPTGLMLANELKDGIRLAFDPATADNGNYSDGDYWTFPVRSAGTAFDPSVWPTNAAPQGVQHRRASLGILEWTAAPVVDISAADGEIHDCRQPFLPLARQRGCCTVTVGDGKQSYGQFKSIQAAVDALPADGGTVCVLAGVYDESVRIARRTSIRIHGCGAQSRVRASVDAKNTAQPAFLIATSSAIVLEDLAIEAGPRSAVQIDNAREVSVRRCLIQMRDLATLWQAIYSRGDDICIEANTLEVLPRTGIPPRAEVPPRVGRPGAPAGVQTPPAAINPGLATRGGIQLAGGSDRVRVIDNLIRGGIWNGITLGSLVDIQRPGDDTPDVPNSEDPCHPCKPPDLGDDDPDLELPRYVSAGDLYDIEIARNRISDMGINGIGVVRFFNLANGGDMIGVHGLHILDNVITRCNRRDLAQVSQAMLLQIGYGGIALAKVSDLRILRNEIVANGNSYLQPICGVFAIVVQGLQLDTNRILDNGLRTGEPVENAQNGVRGGVHIWLVLPPMEQPAYAASSLALRSPRRRNNLPAVALRDNIVSAPLGRALSFFALGSVTVARNRLVSEASTHRGLDLIAATVLIGNLGISNEWTAKLLQIFINLILGKDPESKDLCELAKVEGTIQEPNPNAPGQTPVFLPPLVNRWCSGKTLFSENQVTLDLGEAPNIDFGISSILLFSLDDIGFVDNQCEIVSTNVLYLANAMAFAGSLRVADNRFAETWMRALTSGYFIGLMNTTTDNQATHCLRAVALPAEQIVFKDNIALVRAFCPNECGKRGYGDRD